MLPNMLRWKFEADRTRRMSFGDFSIHLCMLDYISKSIFYSKRTCAYQMAESMQTRPHFPENGDQIYQTYIWYIIYRLYIPTC